MLDLLAETIAKGPAIMEPCPWWQQSMLAAYLIPIIALTPAFILLWFDYRKRKRRDRQ